MIETLHLLALVDSIDGWGAVFGLGGMGSAIATLVTLKADVNYIKDAVAKLHASAELVIEHKVKIESLEREIAELKSENC